MPTLRKNIAIAEYLVQLVVGRRSWRGMLYLVSVALVLSCQLDQAFALIDASGRYVWDPMASLRALKDVPQQLDGLFPLLDKRPRKTDLDRVIVGQKRSYH